MTKTVFVLTGFKDRATDSQYKWLRGFFEKQGLVVRTPSIEWDYRVMSDYVDEFDRYYEQNRTEKNYVLGFSFGAMIAFISAQKLRPDKLYLCSLSPYFKEDLHRLKPYWKKFTGAHRIQDFQRFSAREIGKILTTTTTIFYGEAEAKKYPQLKARCEETSKAIKNSKLVVVKDASHRINHPEYMKAIKKEFGQNRF